MKKIFIITTLGFGGLILLTLAALSATLYYMDSDHCSRMIQQQINSQIPGAIVWKDFNFSLLKGKISLQGYQLMLDGEEVAGVDQVDIALDLARLKQREMAVNLSIDTPRAALLLTEDGQLNILKAFPDTGMTEEKTDKDFFETFPFNVIVESLSVKNGEFQYRSEPDGISARMEGLDISGKGNLLKKSANLMLTTKEIRFQQPGVDCHLEKIALKGQYLVDVISGFSLSMESDAADLSIKGTAENLFEEPQLNVTVDTDLATADIMKMFSLKQDITGDLSIHTVISGTLNDPAVSCHIEYPHGTVLGRKIKKAAFQGSMENRELAITLLEIEHAYAALSAQGNVSLSRAFPQGFLGKGMDLEKISWDLGITGHGIEPGKILETEGVKGISGKCTFSAHVAGNMNNPRADLTFKADRAAYMDYPSLNAHIDLSLEDGVVDVEKMELSSCNAQVDLNGTVQVLEQKQGKKTAQVESENKDSKIYTPVPSPKFNITAASRGKIAIAQCLEQLKLLPDNPIQGDVALRSHLKGTLDNPNLHLNLTADNLMSGGERIENMDIEADYQDKKLVIQSLNIRIADNNTVEAEGWVDEKQHFNLSLESQGIDLSLIEAVRKNAVLKGVASCSVSAKGSFDAPEVEGKIALRRVKVMDKPFEDFTADIVLKNQQARVQGKLNFDIGALFDLRSRDFSAEAVFLKTDLLPWFTFAGVQDIEGGTTGKIEVKGNVDTPDKITALCDIQELFIRHQKHEYGEIRAEKVKIWSDGDSFKVENFRTLLPEKGELTMSASGKIAGEIRAQAAARIPVRVAALFVPDLPPMEGNVTLDVKGKMDLQQGIKGSDVDAALAFKDVAVVLPDDLGRLKQINGTVTGNLNQVEIQHLKGEFNTGSFMVSGKTELKDFMPAAIQASFKARAIPVDMVEGLSAEIHSDINVQGNLKEGVLVSGDVVLAHARWTRDLNVEKTVFSTLTTRKRVRKGGREKKKSNPLLEKIQLDVAVKGETPFIVDNNLAYMEIHPDIKVQGTAQAPVVSGRSEISPGTINYQTSEFTLTRGIIDFVNPYAIEPELNIESQRTVRQWNVMLAVSGTPDNLDFKLSSEPRLEDGDIISLLLRGKTVSELINAEGGTTRSTAGMLSQVAASAVSDNVKSATGLDIFEMGFGNTPDDNGLADMNVTMGKNITDKITVKYGAETEDGEMVHKTSAQYKMTDNVSVTGFQDSAGKFGGEVRYRLEFR